MREPLARVAELVAVSVASLGTAAARVGFCELIATLMGDNPGTRQAAILYDTRLPRLVMGLLVRAALAVAGALMQALFRNPLTDPGIVGGSAAAGRG